MNVKIKKFHPDAVVPQYGRNGDAALDLTAVTAEISQDGKYVTYGFGIGIEIPEGYVGLIFPRSSMYKTGQIQSNSVGVIDSNYRGEIKAMLYTPIIETAGKQYCDCDAFEVGNRVAQLIIMPYPTIEFEEVEELSESNRGIAGFGSTGK